MEQETVNNQGSGPRGNQGKKTNWIVIITLLIVLIVGAGVIVSSLLKKKSPPIIQTDSGAKTTTTSKLRTLETLTFDQASEVKEDPYGDKNGPFYHKVYKATSTDGLTFTGKKLIADKSSVPDVVKMPDGKLFIYAVDGARRSTQGLMVMVSSDNGETWKTGSFSIEVTGEPFAPADPQAVLLDDGRIRLFFVAFPMKKPALDANGVPIPSGEKYKIKSAISTDGLNFEEEEGIRYESTDILTDPDIVKIGSQWFMYMAKGSEQIAASSTDGLTFKLEKTIRPDGAISKTVDIGEGKFRQFFCKSGISSAVMTDGLNFTNDPGSRIAETTGEIVCDPTPVKVGSGWLLFYKAAPMPKK